MRWLALAALVAACDPDPTRVTVARGDEVLVEVEAEVATTADERARGLRGHAPLAPGEGLLLELPRAVEVCIVNDGVDFAIDAVYAGDDGTVVAVEAGIGAGDGSARCHDGVRHVLEVAAGVAASAAPGDRLVID